MCDEDRRNFIVSNLKELTTSTVIGAELVVSLFAKRLIDDEEKDLLMDCRTPNISRAVNLYTRSANKWNHDQFEDFRKILNETGNFRALQVFKDGGGEYFLTNEEFEVLKKHKGNELTGCYEGLCYKEESVANKVVELLRHDKLIRNGTFLLAEDLKRIEIIPLIRNFLTILKNQRIWWNARKPKMPSNFIPRKVCKTAKFNPDGSLPSTATSTTLLEVNENFVLLVDPPGMGKSTEITDIEQKLRFKIASNRIIIRINLNEVQKTLSSLCAETPFSVLSKLASFLPVTHIGKEGIRVFVLLDGLDEVCPKHQVTMINLLHILKPIEPLTNVHNRIHVLVTTRPHLRDAIESEFNLESWSLVPLNVEEQTEYMKAELNVTREDVIFQHNNFHSSLQDMLTNPLMLFMLVDILKSDRIVSANTDLNIYDLYTRFVESKHKLQLVEKEKMGAEDNYTEVRLESALSRNLPFYYHVAWNELLVSEDVDDDENKLPPVFNESIEKVAFKATPGLVETELLSYGLLTEKIEDKLVFKHYSFAEYFYARLLLQPETPQGVRDTLFSYIYRQRHYNVEAFVEAAITKSGLEIPLITAKWLVIDGFVNRDFSTLLYFVNGKLFFLLVQTILMSFVTGETQDILEAFCVLVDKREESRTAFGKMFKWMNENRDWSRQNLFTIEFESIINFPTLRYSSPVASLIVAIDMIFESQVLFSAKEVAIALKSCKNLVAIVAAIQIEKKNKWELVEKHFSKIELKDLLKNADHLDFWTLIDDPETVKKFFATFSQQELLSLVSEEETRVTDVIGMEPLRVFISFGEEFLAPRYLAQFRAKYVEKGKTVFELDGCNFALEYLWEDLKKEAGEENSSGPVTVAVREAIGSGFSWELLEKLEDQVRKGRKCPVDEAKEAAETNVMMWVVDGGVVIRNFLIRYTGSISAHQVKNILEQNTKKLNEESSMTMLVKSLVLSSHFSPSCYTEVQIFLKRNLKKIPRKFRSCGGGGLRRNTF